MLYCNNCKVKISGQRKNCPLCQSDLIGTAENSLEVYPAIKNIKSKFSFILKVITFVLLLGIIISTMVDFLTLPEGLVWSKFVALGAVCLWILAFIAINKRPNIFKNLAYQFFAVNILCFAWDIFMGQNLWSTSFVFPCTYVAVTVVMLIIYLIKRKSEKFPIFYLVLLSILSQISVIFIAKGLVPIVLPSVISVATGLLVLSAIIIFKSGTLIKEILKKFHLG